MEIVIKNQGTNIIVLFPSLGENLSPLDNQKIDASFVALAIKLQATISIMEKAPKLFISLACSHYPNISEIARILEEIFLEKIVIQEPSS